MTEINEIQTMTTPKGVYNSFPDKTAREQLGGKLNSPDGVKAGDYLRVKSVGEDGTVVLEGAEGTGGGSGQNLSLDTTLTKSGEAADAKAVGDALDELEEKIPSIEGLAKTEDIPTRPEDIGAQPVGDYLTKAPVVSVNGKAGAVVLSASDVGALPTTYTPPDQTAEQVGADPKGAAASAVSAHNASSDAHNDIRQELAQINARLTAFFNSDNQTLDELSEIVAYITSNKSLIDAITTSKVSVADIVNNLTTNVASKPLSAAQGVAIKALIDGLSSGKLDASTLQEAINTALAQAKASGEFDGEDGYTPVKGKDYKDGADGVSPTVVVSAITGGHRISITDKNGTKTVDVMDGADGDPGRGIKSIARTSGNGAAGTTDTYTITYTDSTTSAFTVRNGSNGAAGQAATLEITGVTALAYGAAPTITEQSGSTAQARKYVVGIPAGKPGTNGVSPTVAVSKSGKVTTIKITDADGTKTAIINDGADGSASVADGSITPEKTSFVVCEGTGETETTLVPNFTNLADPKSADWKTDTRFSSSSGSQSAYTGAIVTNAIKANIGDIVRIKGIKGGTGTTSSALFQVVGYTDAAGTTKCSTSGLLFEKTTAQSGNGIKDIVTVEDDVTTWTAYTYVNPDDGTATQSQGFNGAVSFRIGGVPVGSVDDIIITVNEPITYTEVTSGGKTYTLDEKIIVPRANGLKSGARWFALGDSITQGWASAVDASASNGYKQFLNTNESERWVNIVAEKNGYILTNYGVGGTGYAHHTSGNVNARAQVANIDFSQCDMVTLAFGVNDWKGKATLGSMDDDVDTVDAFVPNMRYVIKKILADNPYCKIFVITPINCRSLGDYARNWGIGYDNAEHASGPGLEQIYQLEKTVCEFHGIELIDMTHSSIINRENIRTMLADYVHPTVECHAVMARELARRINFV